MITSKHLNELLNFKTPMSSVVSIYLEISGERGHAGVLSRLLKAAESDPRFAQSQEDFARIRQFVETEFEPGRWRGLAVFSSKRFGLWRVCPLPEPVKSSLRVETAPYLAPLLSMTDQRQRFGVVLADPRGARFLEVFMSQIKEYEDLTMSAEEFSSEHDYLRSISDKLDGLARNQGFQRVVIGVAPELSLNLVNHLHSAVQHNLILDADLGPDRDAAAVLQRILLCESQARQVRETVLVHRLMDKVKCSPRLAVLGLDRTLEALQKGQVRALFAREGYAKLGRRCPQCERLSVSWNKCLECGCATEIVFNLVGEMIARALEARCEVVRLLNDTPLDNVGRIAAELSCDPPETQAPARARQAERVHASR